MNVVYRMEKKHVVFLRSKIGRLLKRGDLKRLSRRVYAVGDGSVFELQRAGVGLKSIFYDNRIRRKKTPKEIREAVAAFRGKKITVKNPRGIITKELWRAVGVAVRNQRKVFVDGEEDLAAVAVMLLARDGELVAYGLPGKGLMVVKTSKALKRTIRKSLEIW